MSEFSKLPGRGMAALVVLAVGVSCGLPALAQSTPADEAVRSATEMAMELGRLDTASQLEGRRLMLEQSRAATKAYRRSLSKDGGPMPVIVSIYTAGKGMRALIDTHASGLRDVGPGDVLTDDLVVNSISGSHGVAVTVGPAAAKKKSIYYLSMKPAISTGLGSMPPGQQGAYPPSAMAPGGMGAGAAMPIPFVQQQLPPPSVGRGYAPDQGGR